MPKLIDLTHIIEDGTPAYPGDERCRLVQTRTVARDGYSSFLFNTGLHAGTHLDAPLHFLAEGKMVKDIPLETFMGRGRLLDVRGEDPIVFKDEYKELVEPGTLCCCGQIAAGSLAGMSIIPLTRLWISAWPNS